MNPRIIVPLDQSSVAESALPLARTLMKQLNARITLLAVLDVPSSFGRYVRAPERTHVGAEQGQARMPSEATPQSPYGNWTGWSGSEPTAKQIEEVSSEMSAAERYLSAIAETFDSDTVETVVRFGRPAERILQTAESRDDAMIVLASHGRSGLGRAVVGSVASRVVQAATRPVFVVRAMRNANGAGEFSPIERVLVPVDGSAFSEQAIAVITEMFKGHDVKMHLLNVIETPRFANQAQSEGYIRWLGEQITETGGSATWQVTQGNAADQINTISSDQDSNLIAMSTHGRTGLDRFVIGSVAEKVLQEAERPLLLIPARMTK
jgi:nucleotide-binding universal stress UspA family protein